MVNIRPMQIPGRWRTGYVLDYHTLSSTYLGDDEYGHAMFDTKRSQVGELLYRLKYRSDKSALNQLAEVAARFVREWNPEVTILVPVPPSRVRAEQPLHLIAERLGTTIGIPVRWNGVTRVKETPELKNVYAYDERLRLLYGAHTVDASVLKGQKVLLFDDLYRSGATMNAITAALYDEGAVADVYALALTRTRSRS
ncbi:MAG: ComF family protein [Deltaproteobacteria bacterium]|nr:ComF family protein [Deltaproteobacteria bacterium]